MTKEEILERLAKPQPLRQVEFSEMTGYDVATLRKLLEGEYIESVMLSGTRKRRIPVAEARKHLVDLRIIDSNETAKTARFGNAPLRAA